MFVKFGLQYFLKRPAVGLFTYGLIDSVSCIVQIFRLSRWIVLEGGAGGSENSRKKFTQSASGDAGCKVEKILPYAVITI